MYVNWIPQVCCDRRVLASYGTPDINHCASTTVELGDATLLGLVQLIVAKPSVFTQSKMVKKKARHWPDDKKPVEYQ